MAYYGGFINRRRRGTWEESVITQVSTRFSLSNMEMTRLTRDGTAEPVSRDQILRHARGQGDIIFPVQLTPSRIGNLIRLIHTLLCVVMTERHPGVWHNGGFESDGVKG